MRLPLAALLILLPGLADAQPARPPDAAATAALPPIGLPLPAIGLPLPPIGLAPPTPTPTQSPPAKPPRRGGNGHRPGRASPGVIYVVPAYGIYGAALPGAPTPGVTTAAPSAPPLENAGDRAPGRPPTGTLRLDLQPRPTGQLFVDDAYVGTLDELGTEFTLVEGKHQLEIRQSGFKPFTLTVRIDEGRALVYRGDLERLAPATSPSTPGTAAPAGTAASAGTAATATTARRADPPPARKPFYFIPGCYLGDVPPKDAGLPASCDPSRAVIFRP